MQRYLTVISAFFIMLCVGSVYAWSMISSELINNFDFSSVQSQLVFGTIIAIFPVTMIFAGKFEKLLGVRTLTLLSALFFSVGYIVSGLSDGNFYIILAGIGVFGGIGTGLGYFVSITTPAKWFTEKKGLVTGITVAGFGLASFIFSMVIENLLISGKSILDLFVIIGIVYGIIILFFSNFIKVPLTDKTVVITKQTFKVDGKFIKLFFGIFFGTFAGLLIIGSLKLIGSVHNISNHSLVIGVSVFAIANFSGRLFFGALSDYIGASICIFLALLLQAVSIFFLGYLDLNSVTYIALSFLIGFGFGGNFVLFAKETAQVFGIHDFGIIYPYVFLGYAIAGIFGPLTGGFLYDRFNNYDFASYTASVMSLIGGLIFLVNYIVSKITSNNKS